jgi:hypothetical protein
MRHRTNVHALCLAPPVRWEPCSGFHDDPADAGTCGRCGYPPDDHDPTAAPVTVLGPLAASPWSDAVSLPRAS